MSAVYLTLWTRGFSWKIQRPSHTGPALLRGSSQMGLNGRFFRHLGCTLYTHPSPSQVYCIRSVTFLALAVPLSPLLESVLGPGWVICHQTMFSMALTPPDSLMMLGKVSLVKCTQIQTLITHDPSVKIMDPLKPTHRKMLSFKHLCMDKKIHLYSSLDY